MSFVATSIGVPSDIVTPPTLWPRSFTFERITVSLFIRFSAILMIRLFFRVRLRKVRCFAPCAMILLAGLAVAACNTPADAPAPEFGEAVYNNMAAHIIDPQPPESMELPPADGVRRSLMISRVDEAFKVAVAISLGLFIAYIVNALLPVPLVNHSRNIPAIQTPLPGLYFASMSQVYPWDRGTNFAVEIGRRAARGAEQAAPAPLAAGVVDQGEVALLHRPDALVVVEDARVGARADDRREARAGRSARPWAGRAHRCPRGSCGPSRRAGAARRPPEAFDAIGRGES